MVAGTLISQDDGLGSLTVTEEAQLLPDTGSVMVTMTGASISAQLTVDGLMTAPGIQAPGGSDNSISGVSVIVPDGPRFTSKVA